LSEIWRAYIARFSLEHTFRFFKQNPALDRPQAPLTQRR
jgi:hypothetical protein